MRSRSSTGPTRRSGSSTGETKCGCTNVRVGARVIPPGTQTTIEATIDTTKFLGYKPSGLTLIFERPTFAEVDLNLSCFIRGDIVMNPGQIDFGIVRRAEKMPTASLTLTYAGGRSDWEVTKMKTLSNKIKAELRELEPDGRRADQLTRLTATLQPGVPNGYFQGRDHAHHQRPDEPDDTDLGGRQYPERGIGHAVDHQFRRRSPGQTISKTVIVRSSQPFSITKLSASQDELRAGR